jgi:signal transduction histidine kinase
LNGIGMINMRERAEMLGGTFLVESSPDKGTDIIVEIPLP